MSSSSTPYNSNHKIIGIMAAKRALHVAKKRDSNTFQKIYFIYEKPDQDEPQSATNSHTEVNAPPLAEITRYFPKLPHKANHDESLGLGQGNFGSVQKRKNPNSTLVKKILTPRIGSELAIQSDRYTELLQIYLNTEFQNKYGKHFCIPFLNEKGNILMPEVKGTSLEVLSRWGKVRIKKSAIQSLLKAMEEMCDTFHIVHKDVHSGNIMQNQGGDLVLIDFDECMKRQDDPPMVLNPDYDENDYGSAEPKMVPGEGQSEKNPSCYVSDAIFEAEKTRMFLNFKRIFCIDQKSVFELDDFKNAEGSLEFDMEIIPRKSSNSGGS